MIGSKVCFISTLTLGLIGSSAFASFISTGVYDENTVQPNTVDASATTLTVGSFSTLITNNYSLGKAGVVDFGTGSLNASGGIDAKYAPTAGSGTETKSLAIGLTSGTTLSTNYVVAGSTLAPISNADTSNILKAPTPGNITFSIGSITGGLTNERVTSFGFTLLTQTVLTSVTYTATATFDDGTTASANKTLGRVTTNSPTLDNFWGFTAPTGHYITSLAFTTNAGAGRDVTHIDDVGFVTSVIPEPAAMALLGLAGVVGLRRRRIA